MKRILLIVLTMVLMLNTVTVVFADNDAKIAVTLNGEEIEFDQPPVMIEDSILVPIRSVCESLGADVYWYPEEQSIMVVKNEIKLAFKLGDRELGKFIIDSFSELFEKYVNIHFELIALDSAPQLINDRTYLPIRAVCEELGAIVKWNEEINTVEILCEENIIADKNRDTTFFDEFIEFTKFANNQDNDWFEEIYYNYSDYDYISRMCIAEFEDTEDNEDYVLAREIIKARVEVMENIKSLTICLPKELILVSISYDEGFDMEKAASMLTSEPKFYITDSNNNIIIDKSDVSDAKPHKDDQNYGIEISLTEEGKKKFAVATEEIAEREDENNISVYVDDILISSPSIMAKMDSDKVIITGDFDYRQAKDYAYLIQTKGAPRLKSMFVNISETK